MRLSAITLLSTLLTLGCTVGQQAMAQGTISASEASSGTATPAAQSRLSETGRDPAQFPAYVEQLKRQALAQGISPAIVDSAFTDVHFVISRKRKSRWTTTSNAYCHPPRSHKAVRYISSIILSFRGSPRTTACRDVMLWHCGAWKAPSVKSRGVKM